MKLSSGFGRILCTFFLIWLVSACSSTPGASTGQVGYTETGTASFYADNYQSRETASGERFDQGASTAAHKNLPFNTRVRVTNLENGQSTVVRINDRGPFVRGRIIDLSSSAFGEISAAGNGLVRVKIEVIE